MERKLTAILAADVVGYTRLVGADETGTLRRFTELRQRLLEPLIAAHHGRVVKLMGDGLLVEFASVVDALTCAVAWQNDVAEREAETDEDKRLNFRIGINLGDVIVEDDDIYGDGVIIAARLEGIADPGGVCISQQVYDQVRNKLEFGFEDLGKRNLKNIAEPIRAFRIQGRFAQTSRAGPTSGPEPSLVLPDKPSIAVLPFVSMSSDPEHEYFADGITEDITTVLSMISEIFVIARSSTLIYKDKPCKVQQVSEALGVRYVLEGSVKWSGDRVRISTQLVDALKGHHVWAEYYDREVKDLFALQDEITLAVVTALQVEMTEGEQERIALMHGTTNLRAWILVSQGLHLGRRLTREDVSKAREFFKKAAQLDPNYPGAWHGLAWIDFIDAWFGWSESREASMRCAAQLAQKTLALDPTRPRTYGLLGIIQLVNGDHEQALALGEKAISLSPSGADMAALLAITLTYTGELERSIALIKRAMRFSPYYPDWYRWVLGRAYRLSARYEEAITLLATSIDDTPDSSLPHIELAATYSEMGRDSEARIQAAEVIRIDPRFSARYWTQAPPYKDTAMTKREFNVLRQAGLPE